MEDTKSNAPGINDIPETALAWHRAGKGAVLATVIETWGSAPRVVGSQLAISGAGEFAGSVSGGCVEGAVIVEALDALQDAKPLILDYGVSDDDAFAVGLGCGGDIRVLVEPVGNVLPENLLAEICDLRQQRCGVAYVVNTEVWERSVIQQGDPLLAAAISERFRADKSGFEGADFVTIHNPPLRMAIVGAVHIAQALLPMARLAGFDPVLVDPRQTFAAAHRFQGERIITDWPDEALNAYGLDARTAVITLSHDPKLDDPAILMALKSDVFYLGCLGSTRTHEKRVARLRDFGATDEQIARIHAPVGLDIGAKSPAEIAISVMAEITQSLRCN